MAKVSRRGLFKRAAVVAAAAPLGLVVGPELVKQEPDVEAERMFADAADETPTVVPRRVLTHGTYYLADPWDTPLAARWEWYEEDLWKGRVPDG